MSQISQHRRALSYTAIFVVLTALVGLLFVCSIVTGSTNVSLKEIWDILWGGGEEWAKAIVMQFRLPKAITALLCGIGLAVCGLQMQTLFRNPLADPFIMGVSSGAGIGAALFLMGGVLAGSVAGAFGVVGAALVGAVAVTAFIMASAKRIKNSNSLLLLGVMIGSVSQAVITMLQYVAPEGSLKMYVLWTMGSFSGLTMSKVAVLAGFVIVGVLLSVANIKSLNVMLMGEGYARGLGLSINKIYNRILLSVAIVAGAVTAFCGPVGFIGIVSPHVARFMVKNSNHKVLMPASGLVGAAFALLACLLSQGIVSETILPINTITAFLGIPVIIYIISKGGGQHE